MCAIVDTDRWHHVFPTSGGSPDPLRAWLSRRAGFLALGGKLLGEITGHSQRERLVQALIGSGQIREYSAQAVCEEERRVRQQNLCRSNDTHVIALARVSGARLLYSGDHDLCKDFKDRRILRGEKLYPQQPGQRLREHRQRVLRAHRCPSGLRHS